MRAEPSASNARNASASACAVSRSTAFFATGRSRITVVTGPPRSIRTIVATVAGTFCGMAGCKRIAILTSGGDAPGMNAAIRAATLVGRAAGAEILGIERGYRGLLDDAFVELGPNDVAGILREGGTILGSARCKEFHERAVRDRAREILARHAIDGLVV